MHGVGVVGVVYAVLAALCWSIAALLYRLGMTSIQNPFAGNWPRFLIALPVVLAYGLYNGLKYSLAGLVYAIGAGILIGVVGDCLYLSALRDADVSIVYPVAYTYVVASAFFATTMLGEKPSHSLWVGLALVLLGVLFLSRSKSSRAHGSRVLRAVVEASIASIAWGLGVCIAKIAAEETSPVLVDVVKLTTIAILLSPWAPQSLQLPRRTLLLIAIGGFFGVGVGDLLLYMSLPIIGAAQATLVSTISLPLTLVLSRIALKEKLNIGKVLGMTLIALGVLVSVS